MIPVCHTADPGSIPLAAKMFFVFLFQTDFNLFNFIFSTNLTMHFLPKLYMFLQAKKTLLYLVNILKSLSYEWTRGRCIPQLSALYTLKTIMESFRDRNTHAWLIDT